MLVQVGAQHVRQQCGVAGVGLLARLPVPLPVASDRPWVDRKHCQAGCLQRHHDQVLVGLDRDRHRTRVVGVLGEQRHQLPEPGQACVNLASAQNLTALVQDGDVVMRLGPVDPARDLHMFPLARFRC